jgi:hypothetical protein
MGYTSFELSLINTLVIVNDIGPYSISGNLNFSSSEIFSCVIERTEFKHEINFSKSVFGNPRYFTDCLLINNDSRYYPYFIMGKFINELKERKTYKTKLFYNSLSEDLKEKIDSGEIIKDMRTTKNGVHLVTELEKAVPFMTELNNKINDVC